MNGPNSASGRIKVATKEFDDESGALDLVFANSKQLSVTLDELPAEIIRALAGHGLSQKIGDSYASVKGNADLAFDNAAKVIENLKNGSWTSRVVGEGKGRVSELAEAIARLKGVDIAKASAAVAQATEDTLKVWRSNAKVKAKIAEIRAEKAAARVAKDGGEGEISIDL